MIRKIIVDSKGNGDFTTIQEALKVQDEEVFITLKSGTYYGQIFSTKKKLYIKGENPERTIITGKIGAKDPFGDGSITGTFRSYTAYFSGESVTLENLTIENTAGQGTLVGQSVALYASASFVFCKNVRLLSYQDTLFTAPLPEKERLPGGFRGPEENLPRKHSTQFYENCYICGTVDFIFGSADAFFKNCTIGVRETTTECYITAPSTPKGKTGYIFDSCKIKKHIDNFADSHGENTSKNVNNTKHEKIYLGRPWREFAKCCWLNSIFSDIICKDAWDNWSNTENEKTTTFAVYKNTWKHPGIAGISEKDFQRFQNGLENQMFAKVLNKTQAEKVMHSAEELRKKVISACLPETISDCL